MAGGMAQQRKFCSTRIFILQGAYSALPTANQYDSNVGNDLVIQQSKFYLKETIKQLEVGIWKNV